jgi:adenylate cyclase
MRAMAGFLATVLICEDEPALRELIRVSLVGPYEFAEADDGEESLAAARRLQPDLVILDVMMPRRSGIEVLAELRKDEALASTPVIVLTAQPETRDEALRAGADRVIDKPFVPDEISSAVEEVLAARR